MERSFLRKRSVQHVFKWTVAISFSLFTFYQIIMAILIEQTRIGRLIGITFYLLITVASFVVLAKNKHKSKAKKERTQTVQMVLLVTGLLCLFIARLLSIGTVFGNLDFAYPATVLNAASYILSQLGTLAIVSGHLVLRSKLNPDDMKTYSNLLMKLAIVLYYTCFLAECVMLIRYRFNIELSLKFTLISRLLFFIGFAGTAFCFMLPTPVGRKKHRSGSFYYSEEDKDDIELVM